MGFVGVMFLLSTVNHHVVAYVLFLSKRRVSKSKFFERGWFCGVAVGFHVGCPAAPNAKVHRLRRKPTKDEQLKVLDLRTAQGFFNLSG